MDLSYVKEKRILLVDDEETILYMIQGSGDGDEVHRPHHLLL